MENHVYRICLELTVVVSEAFMARWVRLYLEKVREAKGDIKFLKDMMTIPTKL